jgi:lipopolysaccharide transport system ATP-binding protein
MSDVAIRVEGLSKQYHIGGKQERYKTLRDSLADAFAAPFRRAGKLLRGQAAGAAELDETIWALKDVSFEVKRGEVIGIIGRNGAGKTTLLKILSRITEPTEGHAEVHGRVGSLLEVGTGFHPELTGRENIFLNGAILGMKRQEIERKFDEIVAFAEMEKFIDTPVKHYSSGMYVRLAFAVAAHLEPEILLVDEVLSVGDIAFRKKSMGKMSNVAEEGGRTILFVSHDMASISALCHRSIYLTQGRIEAIGLTNEIVRQYMIASGSGERQVPLAQRADRRGDGRVRVTGLRVLDSMSRRPIQCIISGHDVCVEVSYKAQDPSPVWRDSILVSLSLPPLDNL